MKKRFIALITGCLFIAGLTIGAFAVGSIQIVVNGEKIKTDVSPQIIKGRTMVPLRTIAETLGAGVKWDQTNQKVEINTLSRVWQEPFDPWKDLEAYQAVYVVNEYLALLQGAVWGGDLYDYPFLFSKRVREAAEPWTLVWQPASSGMVGSSLCRLNFQVLDGHIAGKDENGRPVFEIAARVQSYDPRGGEPVFTEWIKAYKLITEEYIHEDGNKSLHTVIDGERIIKEVQMKTNEMPDFLDSLFR